jgi:hypothetical protein
MVCPCGTELHGFGTGVYLKNGGFAYQIADILPKRCLHAFTELGTQLQVKRGKVTVVGRGHTADVVKKFGPGPDERCEGRAYSQSAS